MPPVQDRPPSYRAYMLRCWEARGERPGQPGTWRFSLENVQTKEKRGFDGLPALVAYLREELATDNPGPSGKRIPTSVTRNPELA
jgi:hypothetical protein